MLSQTDVVFDIDQLRNVCMEDSELMRELVTALIDDATKQLSVLSHAVEHGDANQYAAAERQKSLRYRWNFSQTNSGEGSNQSEQHQIDESKIEARHPESSTPL